MWKKHDALTFRIQLASQQSALVCVLLLAGGMSEITAFYRFVIGRIFKDTLRISLVSKFMCCCHCSNYISSTLLIFIQVVKCVRL